jgi:hypothetical protein
MVVLLLQIAASLLLPFDGFKERLEVAFAEATASFALNNLKEQSGAIFYRAGKDLQHITFIVAIHQDAEPFEFIQRFINPADALL